MKLQKHFAYNYKCKKHYKSVVVIPDRIVLKLGWENEQDLESKIEGSKLILFVKGSAP